jgi:hypothetical protein
VPPVYHFTHGSNLAEILKDGELRAHRTASPVTDVADVSIKARRMLTTVPCGAGGKVGDYVPFYFAPRSPMLFSISRGNVEAVDAEQRGLIYLVSSTEAIVEAQRRCVFTDGNAAHAFTAFHDDLQRLGDVVDWPLMQEHYWRNTPEDNDRRRRRGAEFLVHGTVPLPLIHEVGVYDTGVKTRVLEIAASAGISVNAHIRRDWYF